MLWSGLPKIDFASWDSLKVLLAAVLIGFFASFIAFVLQSIGQKHSNEAEAAILISTESVFGPLFAILFYNEVIKYNIILGMILVFAGVILSEIDILDIIKQNKKNRIKTDKS
jgi:drug/metabolite transporter (DMT)-like permease